MQEWGRETSWEEVSPHNCTAIASEHDKQLQRVRLQTAGAQHSGQGGDGLVMGCGRDQWGPAAAYCAAAVQWVVIRDRAARSQSRWSAAAALNWLIDSSLCYYDVSQSRLSSYRISSTNVTPFKHFNSLHHNTRNYVFTEHSQYPNFIKTTDWIRYEWLKPPGVFTAV